MASSKSKSKSKTPQSKSKASTPKGKQASSKSSSAKSKAVSEKSDSLKRTRSLASVKSKSPEPIKKQKLSQSKEKKAATTPPPAINTKAESKAKGKKEAKLTKKETSKKLSEKKQGVVTPTQLVEPSKKNKGKKVKEETKKDDSKPVADAKKDDDKKIVKVTKKGGAVVDTHCPVAAQVHVFIFGSKIYDQTLNQSNLAHNNNKYYILQVLQKDSDPTSFYFWTRWGRVGVPGQNALMGPLSKDQAVTLFDKKLYDKTSKGEYTKIDINYDEDEKEAVVKAPTKKLKISGNVKLNRSQSLLDTRLQNLISLIFDIKMMNHQMKEIGYDAKKMPLGKLAKSTVQQGYQVLNDLMDAIKNKTGKSQYETLSSKFYSLIPHDFGFQKMSNFILDTEEKVTKKLDMLQSLSDMQVATKILAGGSSAEENIIDANYRKLECKLVPLDQKSQEYKLIQQYITDSKGSWKIQLTDVFTVERKGEQERFKDVGNRLLLWHGSGIGNFAGILSQGLRIAPPEAPVSGYRFGKGIYFADMIEKSAGYCRAYNQDACALLGDVACGNFSLKYGSDHNANNLPKGKHSTLGVGNVGPPEETWDNLDKDVRIPLGKPKPITGAGYGNNEYIVYDISQVKMRFLIRMKLG